MSMSAARSHAARISEIEGTDVVQLTGPDGVSVSVALRLGNNAYEFLVNGKNAFWFPHGSVGEFVRAPDLCGNPFLAPWANRLDEHAFFANGTRYELNRGLDNYLLDSDQQPIHGLLLHSPHWELASLRAGPDAAVASSVLDFARFPRLMAQFPFAHRIRMTYRLAGSTLETRTVVTNTGAEAMPVSVGFHPYFNLHDCPRDSWTVRLAARSVWALDSRFTPTGATVETGAALPVDEKGDLPLRGSFLDHVFGHLKRDADGWTRFHVRGLRERLTVAYGPGYPTAVVYAPTGDRQSFVCFEPMSGITNAFNLAHRGVYSGLPSIPPGESWEGVYRISVEGF